MNDTEGNESLNAKELPDDLLPTPKETEEYVAYLYKLYETEGNITLPLWTFDKEVRSNYDRLKMEYARKQAILEGHRHINLRVEAIEQVMESLEVPGSLLFGLPGVAHALYRKTQQKGDELVRRLICGEKVKGRQWVYYSNLMSLKKLLSKTIDDIHEYLEGNTVLDFYEDSQEMDLDLCLHQVMSRTAPGVMTRGWRGRSREGGRERFDVFISHAGEDKRTLAMPLNERLTQHGVKCFLDIENLRPGDLGWDSMDHAMETATIGVMILSPEFAAKRWPMKELDCFLKRREEEGVRVGVIPVFYRLEREECGEGVIIEGIEMFKRLGFFERVTKKETSVQFVVDTLQKVAMIDGIENDEDGAGNWNSEEMTRRREHLIDKIVHKVRSALETSST